MRTLCGQKSMETIKLQALLAQMGFYTLKSHLLGVGATCTSLWGGDGDSEFGGVLSCCCPSELVGFRSSSAPWEGVSVWFCAQCSLKHHGRLKGVFGSVVMRFLIWEAMEEGLSHGADPCFTFPSLCGWRRPPAPSALTLLSRSHR